MEGTPSGVPASSGALAPRSQWTRGKFRPPVGPRKWNAGPQWVSALYRDSERNGDSGEKGHCYPGWSPCLPSHTIYTMAAGIYVLLMASKFPSPSFLGGALSLLPESWEIRPFVYRSDRHFLSRRISSSFDCSPTIRDLEGADDPSGCVVVAGCLSAGLSPSLSSLRFGPVVRSASALASPKMSVLFVGTIVQTILDKLGGANRPRRGGGGHPGVGFFRSSFLLYSNLSSMYMLSWVVLSGCFILPPLGLH